MTGPSEVQIAIGQTALMRNEALAQDIARTPPPTFAPSIADLTTIRPTPAEQLDTLVDRLNPQAAAATRANALDTLARAAAAPSPTASAPTTAPPLAATPFRPAPPTGPRMQLAGVATGGGGWQNPEPQEHVDEKLRPSASSLADTVMDALQASLTGAMYLQWVRMGTYPPWWGPVTGGLVQVEKHLASDLAVYMNSGIPDVTKGLFKENMSKAMNWVREQRALTASRTGGEPVAF